MQKIVDDFMAAVNAGEKNEEILGSLRDDGLDYLLTVITPFEVPDRLIPGLVLLDLRRFLGRSNFACGWVCTRPTELCRVRLLLNRENADFVWRACQIRGVGVPSMITRGREPEEFAVQAVEVVSQALKLDACSIWIDHGFDAAEEISWMR